MAQQDQLGPFSEYLTKPAAASMAPFPVPPVTGLEGTGAAIGNIAMNFINGLRQGRMQKYATQEAEREKQFNAYQQAIKTVAASDLPDQQKQMLHAKLSVPLIQSIAGDKEATSKRTGNPLTDVVKNIATGLVGGNIPKKGQPLSMEPVVEALQMASDPSLSRTRIQSQLDSQAGSRISEILKSQPGADVKTFMTDPELRSIYSQAQQVLGPSVRLPSVEKAYSEFRPMTEMERLAVEREKEKQAAAKEYVGGSPIQPTAAIPSVALTEQRTAAPPAEAAPPSAQRTEGFTQVPMETLEQDRMLAIRAGMPTRESRGEPKMYIDQSTGETFQGFTTSGKSGFGVYRPDKQALYSSGVRELATSELTRPTPQQVEKVYDTSLNALNASVSPKIFQAYKGLLDSMKDQGDMKGMDNVMAQAISADRSEKEQQSRMALAYDAAESRKDAKSAQYIQYINNQLDKNAVAKHYRTTTASVDGAMKALEDAKKDGNYSLADMLIIRAVAKLTDITTGVREGEYDSFSAAKGRLSAVSTEFNNLLKNQADKFDAPTRKRFVNVLNSLTGKARSEYSEELNRLRAVGSEMNIPGKTLDAVLPKVSTQYKKRDEAKGSAADQFKDLGFTPR